MHATSGMPLIVAAAIVVGAAAFTVHNAGPGAHHVTDDAAAEVERIRMHLAAVEAELSAADVSALSPAQRQARERHIAVLREYREAGVFPHNHVMADRRTPVFVDEHGTHCAVGYLLARDGRHDIVEHVRSTRNTASLPELADEPALVAWLEQAGLTAAEAARIQPWYGPSPMPVTRERSTAYTTASLIGVGAGGGMIAWNLLLDGDASRALPGALGLGVGLAEIGLAAYGSALDRRDERDIDRAHVVVNLGVGVVSSLLGLRTLLRATPQAAPAAPGTPVEQGVHWQLSPWVPAGDGGAGMQLRMRF